MFGSCRCRCLALAVVSLWMFLNDSARNVLAKRSSTNIEFGELLVEHFSTCILDKTRRSE
jgi:hypothetical protein